jgi:uroporphyrinogen-III synthase
MAKGSVLITRPEPAARDTADLLMGRGYTAVLAPMLVITPRPWTSVPKAQAILVTSGNALSALAGVDRAMPILAVGDATAMLARGMGFTTVESAGRDAEALAELTALRCKPANGSVLIASGAGQGMALVRDLRSRGLSVQRRMAYCARPVRALPDEAMAALRVGEINHAMFFSAVTARTFVGCMMTEPGLVERVEAHAISARTAAALAPLPWRSIRVASHPNQDELVANLT